VKLSYSRSIAPTVEPVSVSEAKAHLRVDHSDEDSYISTLISVGREIAEQYTNRSFISQSLVVQLDEFSSSNVGIELIYGAVKSITSVVYFDANNDSQVWATSNYRLDLVSKVNEVFAVTSWPETYTRHDAITITYVAGETDATTVNKNVKQAILMIVGHFYENRQEVIVGSQVNMMPKASEYLLASERIFHVAK